jgi:hypothetical protein
LPNLFFLIFVSYFAKVCEEEWLRMVGHALATAACKVSLGAHTLKKKLKERKTN